MDQTTLYEHALCFRSYDIGLVACLLSKGFKLIGLEKNKDSKALFLIMRKEGIDEAIKGYFASECLVSALDFFNHLKALKSQIYSA